MKAINPSFILSICIPTANRPKCLERLLNRLNFELNDQDTSAKVEVCVFNNGNNSETTKVINEYSNQIKYFKFCGSPELLPVGDSFENALRLPSGQYVWMIGDDDLPLLGSLRLIILEILKRLNTQTPIFQLQQHGCASIDEYVMSMNAQCQSVDFKCGTELLTPTAFNWLGQMSTVILLQNFYGPSSLFGKRRNDEIIPLLRSVIDAITSGPACCLTGQLFARTVEASNWKGMMAFAHAIEFPRYYAILHARKPGIGMPFSEKFIVKMVFGTTLLRYYAPKLYHKVQGATPVGILHRIVLIFTRIPLPKAISVFLLKKIFSIRSDKQLVKLLEWESRV